MSINAQNNDEFSPKSFNLPLPQDCIDRFFLKVTPDISVVDAIVLMSQQQSSCVFVVEESQLIGTFTERDVVRITASEVNLSTLKIAEVMTRKVVTLKQSDAQDLFTVVSLLHQHQIRHLPILDDNSQLVGIITPESIRQVLQPANFLKLRYVDDLMTTQVMHAPRTTSVLDIARIMAEHQVSCVAIAETVAGQLESDSPLLPVGIITERDIVQFQVFGLDVAHIPAETVMSTPLFCLKPTDSLWFAHQEMQRRRVRRLVVTGEQGELRGIITQTSFLEVFERLEMSAVIAALQQQVEQQTDELKKANQQLNQEILQRQQLEAELRKATDELEQRVAERTAELSHANALLQQEISDRERAFEQLQQAEENLQQERDFISAILDIIGCLIVVLDRQGRIVSFNQTCEAVTNYSFAEVKGKHFWDIFLVPEEVESVKAVFYQLQAGQFPNQHQNYWLTKQGDRRFIAWSNTAICDRRGEVEYLIGTGIDLTERQQAEAELRTSELHLRALFQGANDAMVIADDRGRYVDANPAACKLFGLPKSDLLGRMIAEFAEPGFDFIQAWQDFQASGKATGEFRLLRPDGTIREVEYGATANFIPDRHLSILRDISDRRQAEAALRKSEVQLKLALEAAQTAIWDWNILDNKITGSENLPAMFGLLPDQFDGTFETFINLVHPQDRELVRHAVMRAIQEQANYSMEFRIVLPNGNIRWVATKGQVFYDQAAKAVRMMGVDMDISDRKQAEQKILEQAALLDVATDAIVVRNLSQEILFWNLGAERLYGWSAEEALNKNANNLLYKKMLPQLESALKTVVEQGEWHGELHQVTKDGADIVVEGRWTLVRDEAGNPKSILIVNTNITEKKQLEAQFLRAQRLESLGTLASGIAHDLNNILTPILTSSQLLALKLNNVDARNQQLLKIIENNSKRGADLVKQILTFARGSEGKRLPLQIENLLTEIQHITNSTFPKSIIIKTNLRTTNLWTVSADSTQIHQVLMNLCVNARDAMPNGGTLHLQAENILIDETYAKMNLDAQVGQYVVITISDTGLGIPPHILDRIFEPFFTTKEQGKGTGLGLSTVIGIVKNHGGFVKVYSELGKGTQFQVYLPAGSYNTSQQVEDVELHNGRGETILVVDDETAILEIVKTSLEDYNYRTLTASNGIEAISLYSQHQDEISLILLDLMMPSMDGLTAIQVLQQINPQVKIIVMSGIAARGQLAEVTNINIFLHKPYTIKELLQAIEQAQRS